MNQRKGSALLMVLLLMTGVSLLLMNLNYRFSLLVQSVIQREKQIRSNCAAQACMFYAIQLAKYNWNSIIMKTQYERLSYTSLSWYITPKEVVQASISFERVGDALLITVELGDSGDHIREAISCKVTPVNKVLKDVQLIVSDWKER
jgi:hypothetical protein